MARIYSVADKISVNIGGLIFKISPLTLAQKMDIESDILKGDIANIMQGSVKAVQYALKDVSGLENSDGSPYSLKFEDGIVSKGCMDELFNIEQSQSLTLVCLNLLKSIPDQFINPNTGEKLEGVEIIKSGGPKGKKK